MKTAIVFGATSGIGKEISELLLKDGYKVAITGRRLKKLEALKKQYSNQVYVAQNDIQKVDEVENVFNEIIKEFTTIDLIIQSSGVGHINPTLAWNKEEETIFTNVVGATKLYDLSFKILFISCRIFAGEQSSCISSLTTSLSIIKFTKEINFKLTNLFPI